MNDRFKFRYYDLNTMYNVKMLDIAENEVYITLDESNYGFSMFLIKKEDFNENKLMQCTGKKDKRGKLIYEDDICTWTHCVMKDDECHDEYETVRIVWDKKYTQFGMIYNGGFTEMPIQTELKIEVIGNMYENPELLR